MKCVAGVKYKLELRGQIDASKKSENNKKRDPLQMNSANNHRTKNIQTSKEKRTKLTSLFKRNQVM